MKKLFMTLLCLLFINNIFARTVDARESEKNKYLVEGDTICEYRGKFPQVGEIRTVKYYCLEAKETCFMVVEKGHKRMSFVNLPFKLCSHLLK